MGNICIFRSTRYGNIYWNRFVTKDITFWTNMQQSTNGWTMATFPHASKSTNDNFSAILRVPAWILGREIGIFLEQSVWNRNYELVWEHHCSNAYLNGWGSIRSYTRDVRLIGCWICAWQTPNCCATIVDFSRVWFFRYGSWPSPFAKETSFHLYYASNDT